MHENPRANGMHRPHVRHRTASQQIHSLCYMCCSNSINYSFPIRFYPSSCVFFHNSLLHFTSLFSSCSLTEPRRRSAKITSAYRRYIHQQLTNVIRQREKAREKEKRKKMPTMLNEFCKRLSDDTSIA